MIPHRSSLAVAFLSLSLGCATGPSTPPPKDTAPPVTSAPAPKLDESLIPRDVFFGNPDRIDPRVSPDGKRIAFLAPVEGVLNVWIAPAAKIEEAKAVTEDQHRGIRSYTWAHDGRHLLYVQDKAGDENWHVFATDVVRGGTRDLTPLDGVRAQIVHVSPKKKGQIVVALNDRDKRFHDLHTVDLKSGKRTALEINDQGFLGYEVDDNHRAALAYRPLPTGGMDVLKKEGKGWKALLSIAPEDMMQTDGAGLDASGRTLYLLDSTGRDTAALYALDLKSGKRKLLLEDPRADLGDVMIHPTKRVVEAVAATYQRLSWHFLDKKVEAHFEVLRSTLGEGDFRVTSRSLDDRWWVVARDVDNGPQRYYLYDTKTKKEPRYLFAHRAALEKLELARMHPLVLDARDGNKLVSYLTLPPSADPDANGVPDAALPMVLFVHGGPWHRDEWGYDGIHQWLASRGYAVLSVNFRGSTGFGKAFTNAANAEWAGKMHDDLLDAKDWAIASKIADPNRIAIMGGSYGGYATLVGLTFTPEAFTCGVDIVGPSSLVTLLENVPPYWAPFLPVLTTRVGDPSTPEGRAFLESRSPLFKADQIKRPLLIGQGANDPRVKQQESDQIVKAMQARNIPVTYVLFPDEGHGFRRPPNSLAFFAVSEIFLSQCLGGKTQPIGAAFTGSTIEVPAGVEQVHTLKEALAARTSTAAATTP